ncbi:murein transglycosylase A [Beijerinckia sp. L45]|uniref:murein transglycosylase A n=1 Tax=Beijerinckia sp. L45 TaxID=1641855 RepID=UPI001FEE1D9A|nr:MltA domain-containing protein [Beijerinckia sp. L45]
MIAEPIPGVPVSFSDLPGFSEDDHAAALKTFRASCGAVVSNTPALRSARPAPPGLAAVCRWALALDPTTGNADARRFFEMYFAPRRLDPGFLTGYYEPVVDGSLTATSEFSTPLLARPPDLVGGIPGQSISGLDPALSAVRRLPDGTLAAYPDRAAIESGALGTLAAPLVYVRDPVEAFFIHVQGSARVHLPDGSMRRLVYAGRNGQPYTSIGRALVEQLNIPPAEMGMAQLKAWIRDHGQKPGQAGATLMQRNRSFIFFVFDDSLAPDAGPIGGAGVSLTPLRSLAVDRLIWPYGLPVFIDATLPWRSDTLEPFRRLMVAQDTGSAIVGPARGDIFFGTGPDAARLAGPIRHPGTFFVLWPKDEVGISK